MRDPSQPRYAVCGVIHLAYLHANKRIKGQGIAKLCGWGPWGPEEPLRRLAHEGRTIENPDGDPDLQVDSLSKSAAARAKLRDSSVLHAATEALRDRLADRVLQCDALLARKTLRGVVKDGDEEVAQLDRVRYDEFCKWEQKQKAKSDDNSLSTQGELWSEPEQRAKLAARKRAREEKVAKSEAYKKRRTEAAEQKIIDAHKKKEADATKMAEEASVADALKQSGCWTSSTGFVKASDMTDFLRVNK
jgi:hypothetical protein